MRSPTEPIAEPATFEGIVRADGRVATRNYLGVLTTVNCSASAARFIAEQFRGGACAEFPNIDGVVALGHGTGCGMGIDGEPMNLLRRTIAGYARHPNFAGVLVLGLGCETNQIAGLLAAEGLEESRPLTTMTIQDTGGTTKTVREGVARLKAMLPAANDVRREPVSASHLTLALQCGGSDGYSGITANPALGACVDLLVRHGGTAVLVGDAGNLRRRASADPPRRQPRGRREARRAHPLVGGLHRQDRRRDEQQPVARQQGRRADDDPRKIAGRGRQGRQHQPRRRLPLCRADHQEGLRVHGHAGLRPGLGDRSGRRRRQHHLLHHRAAARCSAASPRRR